MSALFPLYLLGLAGLALPWLLHRFSHHEPPRQAFPSTRFLEATRPPPTSKRQLRHKPLLLLRLLFLAVLCLLFAQLWLNTDAAKRESESTQLLVMDTSLSMQAADRWSAGLELMNDAVDSLSEGTAMQLLSAGGALQALTDITSSKSEIKTALLRAKPGFMAQDYGEFMQRLDAFADDIRGPVAATFVTDAQRSNMPAKSALLQANAIASLTLRSVNPGAQVNLFVTADARSSDSVTARVLVNLSASGSSATNIPVLQRTVTVSHDEKVLEQQRVELAAGQNKTLVFEQVALPSVATPVLAVSVSEQDALEIDNSQQVPVAGLSPLDVAIVTTSDGPSRNAAVYLGTALDTNVDVKSRLLPISSGFVPDSGNAIAIAEFDADGELPPAMMRFAEQGGNLLVVRQARAAQQNAPAEKTHLIAGIDRTHPLALDSINWKQTRFYEPAALTAQDGDEVLLRLSNGVPLLLERAVDGPGTVLLLNDNLEGFISNLPLQPEFVVLVQRMVDYFVSNGAIPSRVLAGDVITLPANVQVSDPAGNSMLTLAETASSRALPLVEPGLYTVLGANRQQTVLVTTDPRESDMAVLDAGQLEGWRKRNDVSSNSENTGVEQSQSTLAGPVDNIAKNSLWRYLLPCLVVLLVVESLTANRHLRIRRDGL